MRILNSTTARAALILVAIVTLGDSTNCNSVQNKPRLMSVGFYKENLGAGKTVVDLHKASIQAFYMWFEGPNAWGVLKARISSTEVANLRKVADKAALRSFRPKSSWFKTLPPPDQGTDLVLAWDDKEVVYAIPPRVMRKSLSKETKKAYALMDAIVCSLNELEYKYAQDKFHITKVSASGKEYKQFSKELDQVLDKSLPEERIGW